MWKKIKDQFRWKIMDPLRRRFEKPYLRTKAEIEFKILKDTGKRPLVLPYEKQILRLVTKFTRRGHDNFVTPIIAAELTDVIQSLLQGDPISPITDCDDHWEKPNYNGVQYHIRMPSIFKEVGDGRARYTISILFRDLDEGVVFSGCVEDILSSNYISFPFIPKTFYIDVRKEMIGEDDYDYKIVDKTQLDPVWEVYEQAVHADKIDG